MSDSSALAAGTENPLKQRILDALKVSKQQIEAKKQKVNFARIIMRFPKINAVFDQIRAVHRKYDVSGDGAISMEELTDAVSDMINAGKAGKSKPMSPELIKKVFSLSEFRHEQSENLLNEKEFIVLCVIGFILSQDNNEEATIGGMMASGDDAFRSAMMDVVTAYLTFDREGKGYVTIDEFNGYLSTSKQADVARGVFTEDRWKELDISGDGQVDFEEFVYAFSQWVSLDDDEEDEDNEGGDEVEKLNPMKKGVLLALQFTKDRLKKEGGKTNFTRIVMRFPKIHKVFEGIRAVHNKYDKDGEGHLDLTELNLAMAELVNSDKGKEEAIDNEQIEDLFMLSDLSSEGEHEGLDVKEFIVLVAVGFILAEAGGGMAKSVSGKLSSNDTQYREAMMDIVCAYLNFDKEGKGYFTLDDMKNAKEAGTLLTEERWKELDHDGSGQVEFEEFVFAFSTWVSPECEDEEDE